jgi:hypothetical protein
VDQCRGDLGTLLVAQRQLLQRVAGALAQPQPLDQVLGVAAHRVGAETVQAAQVDELVADGHLRVQAPLLGHVPDPAADLAGQPTAFPGHLARVGGEHAHDDAHRGGLARAVRADEPGHAPGGDVEGHPVEHLPVAEPAAHRVEA